MSSIHISLHPGERIFVNGAVLRVDRKVSLEFLNDVTFLLENHVIQPDAATTPLRQLYFVLQTTLMDPANKPETLALFRTMHRATLESFTTPSILSELKFIDGLVSSGRVVDALKRLRALFPVEGEILSGKVPARTEPREMAACK
jgi:flagellar protein FlbT